MTESSQAQSLNELRRNMFQILERLKKKTISTTAATTAVNASNVILRSVALELEYAKMVQQNPHLPCSKMLRPPQLANVSKEQQ
jgi:hypothetical protein